MSEEKVKVYADLSGVSMFQGEVEMSREDAEQVKAWINDGSRFAMERAADLLGAFGNCDVEWEGCDDFRINGEPA